MLVNFNPPPKAALFGSASIHISATGKPVLHLHGDGILPDHLKMLAYAQDGKHFSLFAMDSEGPAGITYGGDLQITPVSLYKTDAAQFSFAGEKLYFSAMREGKRKVYSAVPAERLSAECVEDQVSVGLDGVLPTNYPSPLTLSEIGFDFVTGQPVGRAAYPDPIWLHLAVDLLLPLLEDANLREYQMSRWRRACTVWANKFKKFGKAVPEIPARLEDHLPSWLEVYAVAELHYSVGSNGLRAVKRA